MSVNISTMLSHDILQDILTTDVSCSTISSYSLDENELNLLVLKLITSWTIGVNNMKDIQFAFTGGNRLTTERIVKVVELLKCQNAFCQTLLLLPEKIKLKLVLELCSVLKTDEYPELTQILLQQSSTSYSQNIMGKISRLDISIVNCFFDNIMVIIKNNSDMMLNNARFVLQFLDNFLGNFQLVGSYDLDAFSLLNKNSKYEIKDLLNACKSCPNSIIIRKEEDVLRHFKHLFQFEKYSSILVHLFSTLMDHEKDVSVCGEPKVKELFYRVIYKVKDLSNILASEEICYPKKQDLTFIIQTFLDKLSTFSFADDIIVNTSHLDCNQSHTSNDSMISKWWVEKDKERKFVLAFCCVDNLCYGYEQALSWLLQYGDLNSDKESNIFINHIAAYAINYGSVRFIKRLMTILYDRNDQNHKTRLAHSMQLVIIKCLPYLTIKSCNNLISSFKESFQPDKSLLWSHAYTKEQFHASLSELFNKLTSGKNDISTFSSLAQLSIVSPFVVLHELIKRIFSGTLNHSVLKNILVNIPTFFELELHGEVEECSSPILCFVKNSYTNNKGKRTSQYNIISIITILMEVVPDTLRSDFYHIICDFFVVSNLSYDECNFLDMNVTLEVMAILSQHLDIVSANYNVSLCKILLDIIENNGKDILSVKNSDSMNALIHVLLSNLSHKLTNICGKEKITILTSTRDMLGKYSWITCFYFYELFWSNKYEFQYAVPKSLIEFSNLFDNDVFIPSPNVILSHDAVADDDDDDFVTEDVEKWISLFQICYISHEASSFIIEHIPVFSADEEMCNIIEAVAKVLPSNASVTKGNALITCLTYIVQKQKIERVETWFRNDLCMEVEHHGICLSMLVLIQAFQVHSDLEEENNSEKHSENVQNDIKVFHLFLLYAKDVELVKVRSSILLYLFEQLIFIMAALGEFIANALSLLLMDILIVLLECIKSSPGDISKEIVEQCREILNGVEGKHIVALKEKFNTSLKI